MIKCVLTSLLVLMSFSWAEVIDVILIAGQSNATGQAYVRNIPAQFSTNEKVLIYYSKYMNKGEGAEQWQPLCPASESKDRFGVELSLGTQLQAKYPGRRFALIKHALSGSNLYQQWNPGNIKGQQQGAEYTKFMTAVKDGLEALKQQGHTPVIRAMVWQQGEADARDTAGKKNSEQYGKNLQNFILQVRKDLGVDNMPFIYGTVMPLAAERFTGRDEVKKAQRMIDESSKNPLATKGAKLIEADDLQMRKNDYKTPHPEDDVHLGTYGILVLGERFADAICAAIKKG